MIVEDESLVSLFLQGVLQDLGHSVSGVAPSLRTALAIAACGGGLSAEEDDWCSTHLAEVAAAVPPDRQDDVEYRDDTWKDACRRAYQAR